MTSRPQIPSTPRVISPTPPPSERSNGGKDSYFPSQQTPRSKPAQRQSSVEPIEEHAPNEQEEADHPDFARARRKARSSPQPQTSHHPQRRMGTNGSVTSATKPTPSSSPSTTTQRPTRSRREAEDTTKPPNNLLTPDSAYGGGRGFGAAYWRSLSRSPSPLGLIPVHSSWRAIIHKHEIPRKALHVSIGFLALYLYRSGYNPGDIHPLLLTLLIPITAVDILRFKWPRFNGIYISVLGPFMREAEAHDQFNGVISYLAGLWFTMFFCSKDVGIMSVLLLSWCDTAASTFGRAWGKFTPRIRRGKSLAGSAAAFVVGVGAAVWFWGVLAPAGRGEGLVGDGRGLNEGFAFQGRLVFGEWGVLDGWTAVGVLAGVTGLAASVSEAVDVFGLDDNLTIPVLTGLELGAFLWAFG
ncbi:Diacylglycerol kinase [Elasticomyces elasticus]|nr:Diacylglycerol kinase [Elasticomyces elasticus]